MRIAVLVKQVPRFEAMELGEGGRLVREGLELELNPYCRRAVSKGVELAAATGGSCTVFTLGPRAAEDVLREAVAWGADRGVLISDPAFAGSDTLATARALTAALELTRQGDGPFDLVLVGRNSVDADTGQVGPEVAEMLDLPFATGVRRLDLGDGELKVQCEEDDGQSERIVSLPAVVSTAERLTEPAKVDPPGRAAVDGSLISTLDAATLGAGPWGQDGSGTYVGEVRVLEIERSRVMLDGTVDEQVTEAVRLLVDRDALHESRGEAGAEVLPARGVGGRPVVVALEPDRDNLSHELLGAAAVLARDMAGHVVAFGAPSEVRAGDAAAAGADALVVVHGAESEEDVARALAGWAGREQPWAVLLPGTAWGREVGGRAAARLGAGLTGDAIALEVSTVVSTGETQLLAWKPAFGGRLVAAVYASSPIQMATVRAGVLPRPALRSSVPAIGSSTVHVEPRRRVVTTSTSRDDDIDVLATAERVVCVGTGVRPDEYVELQPLLDVLGAELAATRKVTDKGWQPRARQIGITGRSIAPRLYIGIGLSGKFNHTVGVRAAGTVLAINPDRDAPIWDHTDVGIVGEWRDVVPPLATALAAQLDAQP